ncbi:unnamed protein product [Agarophyton chilense]|eukprot:gb/GEZJ01002625.1/.p1 GENE.gb/GEZJ01002625.1/~~gb/GEZJ01002625.1/.p1  ORF type:complete len:344 (+),score=61.88 gb/GEZJ01002625.1/:1723-2754(+)
MEKPLVVVLGLGEMGYVHATNLSKVRKIRLGIACRRVEVLQAAASKLCADASFNSYEKAISDPDTYAVVIATPPATHPELIEMAANAGKHIFSEKPLGFDSQTIRDSIAHVENAGVRFMTGFMRRWDSAYVSAREAVDKGDIGDPIVLKCTSGDPEYPEKYHRGGAKHSMLKDLAVHDIDLARWLTKSEVKSVYTVTDALSYETLREYQDSDVAICVLEMENRAKVLFHLSRALWYGYNVTSELVCKKGSLRIGALKRVDIEQMKDGTTCQKIAGDFRDRFEEAFEKEMKAFAELICAKSEADAADMMKRNSSYASCWDGLHATAVAEALVRSSESGVPEKVL